MTMSNYPDGMTASDWRHVFGEPEPEEPDEEDPDDVRDRQRERKEDEREKW